MTPQAVVLDTNWTLDLLLFQDPRTHAFASALATSSVRWLATPAMRSELQRVLGYAHLLRFMGRSPSPVADTTRQVLQQFDALTHPAEAAPRCTAQCHDPDDQIFIDLAVAHRAVLLSKDRAVLATHKAAAAQGACVTHHWPA
jgi:predicted nucleic acid-binding protein